MIEMTMRVVCASLDAASKFLFVCLAMLSMNDVIRNDKMINDDGV